MSRIDETAAFYRQQADAFSWCPELRAFYSKAAAEMAAEVGELRSAVSVARKALAEIAKGEGAFSRDPLTHAGNVIDWAVAVARGAGIWLAGSGALLGSVWRAQGKETSLEVTMIDLPNESIETTELGGGDTLSWELMEFLCFIGRAKRER